MEGKGSTKYSKTSQSKRLYKVRPNIITKDWGWEEIWGNVFGKYSSKTLHINMNNSLPLTCHNKKEKTIYVIRGVLTLITKEFQSVDDRMPNEELVEIKQKLGPGEYYHILPGKIHMFSAKKGDVVLVETGTYETDDFVNLKE